MHHHNCPLCNSYEISLFLTCSDYLVSGEIDIRSQNEMRAPLKRALAYEV